MISADIALAKAAGDTPEAARLVLQDRLEETAERLRVAILACPPLMLLDFLWREATEAYLTTDADTETTSDRRCNATLAMEYVHAVLSGHAECPATLVDNSPPMAQVLALAAAVRTLSMAYCWAVSEPGAGGLFGEHTSSVRFSAMQTWIFGRAYRYSEIESEFFQFVLAPHDDALIAAYGVDSVRIAAGLQAAVNALTHVDVPPGARTPAKMGRRLIGEPQNVSLTSKLPSVLIQDLAYERGDECEFFAPGALRGTPFRTMPARIKPLITLENGSYTFDPHFLRDSAYRSIQRGLRARNPSYTRQWTERQTVLTEEAFQRIFSRQLSGAEILKSVYYYDQVDNKWYENDVLILLHDVMLQVEVKGGVMAMHSPALKFETYANKIVKLIIEAYNQCERFLRYASSAPDVPLFIKDEGGYREVRRLRLGDFRTVIPVGLTIEAFTPFSSSCNELDQVRPIAGKYPFVSMSIDDLFVLNRFLPTSGELLHYLTVRQGIAGVKEAFLLDEADHLGMYLNVNRYDRLARFYVKQGMEKVLFTNSARRVDRYFSDPDWRAKVPPKQEFPALLHCVLDSIDTNRTSRFLMADSLIRDLGPERRASLAKAVEEKLPALMSQPYQRILLLGKEPMTVVVQRSDYADFVGDHTVAAELAAQAAETPNSQLLIIYVEKGGRFVGAWAATVWARPR